MAEKNPARSINRLRAESGSEEVIPESSFDQYEPATSYRVGTSTLAVDMTIVDWPNSGKGSVNTSRTNDLLATQSFQPFGSSLSYQRRWDESPPDFSDAFDAGNGVTWDHNKWDVTAGSIKDPVHNTIGMETYHTGGIISKFALPGNFDLYISMRGGRVNTSYSSAISLGPKTIVNNSASLPSPDLVNIYGRNTPWRGYIGYSDNSTPLNPTSTYVLFRVQRVDNQIYFYYRNNITDSWISFGSGTQPPAWTGEDIYVALRGSASNGLAVWSYEFKDFEIQPDSIVIADPPSPASWSDWIEVKSAEEIAQETTDAITEHETVTFDHAAFVKRSVTRFYNLSLDTSVFTVTHIDILKVDVYLNGLKLIPNTEYSSTDSSTTITLSISAILGDDIEFVVWE